MQALNNLVPWAPADSPNFLCLLRPQQPPPSTAEKLLDLQVVCLRELVQQAAPAELADSNQRLRDNLPPEFLDNLPPELLSNPATANRLIFNPAPDGSQLADWKASAAEAVQKPPMSSNQLQEYLTDLDLPTFLDRLL